jgi:hypothetical protein
LTAVLGIAIWGSVSAQSQSASLPPDPKPGECYARVFVPEGQETYTETIEVEPEKVIFKTIPAKYEWASKKVLIEAEAESLAVIPAKYGTVEETIVVKEASKKMVAYPAEYKTVTEKVLVRPAYVTWKKGRGLIERIDEETGEILCRIEVPAEYQTITKQTLVRKAGVREEAIPEVTKTVKKRVMLEPPRTVKTAIPAKYRAVRYQKLVSPAREVRDVAPAKFQSVTKTRMVSDGRLEWRSVLCETNVGDMVMTDLQRALKRAGYDPGPIDGVIGRETMAAMVRYQEAKRLASGRITMETLSALGVRVR